MAVRASLIAGAFLVVTIAGVLASADEPLPVLVEEDFEQGFDRWQTTDPEPAESVWRIEEVRGQETRAQQDQQDQESRAQQDGNHVLRVTGTSKYQPPFRSPHSIALLKDVIVSDFVLTARVQNTNPSAGAHRDLCIFWGYQDPAHFYYVHFGAKADPHACQIFVVDGAARKMITVDEADGTPWTDGWHEIKVVRRTNDGTMEVYFDDMTEPLMTARDKRFQWGQVGIGTFDDHGNFDDIVLRGKRAERR